MEKTIDELLIRFSGKVPIEVEIPMDDQDVYFIVKGQLEKNDIKSNNDDTVTITQVVKVSEVKKYEA